MITKETLEKWHEMLDRYEVTPVMNEMERVIHNWREPESLPTPPAGLTFNEIEVGKEYVFLPRQGTKPYLHNKRVEIVRKKRKYVTGRLLEDAGLYGVGAIFSIPPEALGRLPDVTK